MKAFGKIALAAARWALAALFLYAGIMKMSDPSAFGSAIAHFKILPAGLVNLVALGLPPFEILSALLLLVGPWKRLGAFNLLILCVIFLAALVSAAARGIELNCSCFGSAQGEPLGVAIARDIVLLAVAAVVYWRLARCRSSGSPVSGATLILGLCFTVPSAGAQTIWSSVSVADAFVTTGPTNNLVANNYGGAGGLAVSGSGASRAGNFRGLFESVLRFDLSGAKSAFDAAYGEGLWQVQSASLRLTTTAANNTIFNNNSTGFFFISWMQNDSWIEGTGSPNIPSSTGISWLTLPDFLSLADELLGTFLFDTTTNGGDQTHTTYSLNITSGFLSDIFSGSSAGFDIAAASDGVSYLFNSRSVTTSSDRPALTIVAIPVPEPSSGALLLGCTLVFCIFQGGITFAGRKMTADSL
jgi:uncharacterized membrane protein YphA (DoxX/SURF4 family)